MVGVTETVQSEPADKEGLLYVIYVYILVVSSLDLS